MRCDFRQSWLLFILQGSEMRFPAIVAFIYITRKARCDFRQSWPFVILQGKPDAISGNRGLYLYYRESEGIDAGEK
ncbi:hypothetical protein LQZ18_16585 [Lachnospiraceae bacterium ZAX-1]